MAGASQDYGATGQRRHRRRRGGAAAGVGDADRPQVGGEERPQVGDAEFGHQPGIYAATTGNTQGDRASAAGAGSFDPSMSSTSMPSSMVNNMSPMTNTPAGFSIPTTRTTYGASGDGMNYGLGGLSYNPMGYGPQAYGYAASPLGPFQQLGSQANGCASAVYQSPWTIPHQQIPLSPGVCGGLSRQELPQQVPSGLRQQVPSGLPQQVPSGLPHQVPSGQPQRVLPGQGHQDASSRQPGGIPPDPLQAADPWRGYQPSTSTNAMPVQTAQDFVNGLRTGVQDARARPVASAFEALGKTVPTSPTPDSSPNQSSSTEDWFKKLVEALSGDKRASVPPWSGAPSGLRSWLKQLGMWEQETTTPKSRWGIKLYSALGEEARRIADVVPPETLTTEAGYAAILTTLMARYKPYLEAIGPQSVDNFVYSGDRARGETFAAFLSRKEVQKQELESQLGGEVLNPLVAGRILLRQAGLSEQQQQMIALKTHVLLSYEEVVNALRPLDRLETLSKAAALPGAVPVQRTFLQAGEDADGTEDEEEPEEEEEEYSDSELADDMLRFEDREFDEAEAIYVQAYNDVRKDLRTRKRERGFVRHRGNGGGRRSHTNKKPKGRGKGRKKDGHGRKDDSTIKGTEAELMARTRCFSCQELGHISRNCPHRGSSKGTQKKQFVTVGGTGSSTSTYMFQQLQPMPFPPPHTTLMRAVYAGVRVRAFEGVVDTAAEEAVVGSQSFNGMREELRAAGLRPVPIRRPSSQCAGIGGAARLCGAFDVPTSIAGVLGILRFTVIEDGEGPTGFVTPPLIPISYLETVGASLDLQYDTYVTADGHTTQMRRLPSGHRAIHMFDFETTPWKLPQNLQQNGHDPFLLHPRSSHSILGGGDAARDQRGEALAILTSSTSSGTLTSSFPPTICVDETSGRPMDDVFFETYVEAHVLPGEVPVENETRRRSRSRSKAAPASERADSVAPTVPYTDGTSTAPDGESTEVEVLQELPEERPALQQQSQQPEQAQSSGQVQRPGQAQQSGGDRRLQALQRLRDQRAQGVPPALPLRSSSSYSSDNVSESTDYAVVQRVLHFDQQEEDPPVVMFTNEEGVHIPLDPTQGVLFYLENQQGQRTFLERQDGWRERLPTPNHLRTIPPVLLTKRRWVYATMVDNHMEVINDDWVERPHRCLNQPWFGTVVFFEGRRGGQEPSDDDDDQEDQDRQSSPRSESRGSGPSPTSRPSTTTRPLSSSRPSSSSRPPTSSRQSFTQPSTGRDMQPRPSVRKKGSVRVFNVVETVNRPMEFSLDETDHDGNWCLSPELSKGAQTVTLGSLRMCLKRKSDRALRSPFSSLMSWTLSKAAQAFANRLSRRHGAQEEPDGGSGIASVLHLQDVSGRRRTNTSEEDGNGQVSGSVDAGDDRPVHACADNSAADGSGLSPAEGQCSGRRRGEGLQSQGEAKGQEQGHQDPMDSSGNWSTTVKIHSPKALEREPKNLHSPRRVHAVPSKSTTEVVDMHPMRGTLGKAGSRSVSVLIGNGSSPDAGSQKLADSRGDLPGVSPCTTIQAGAGQYQAEGGRDGPDRASFWEQWIKPCYAQTGFKDNDTERTLSVKRKSANGTSTNPTTQEDGRTNADLQCGGRWTPGVGHQRRGEALGAGGDGGTRCNPSSRLVGKSQLGGRHGRSLGKFLSSRFSKFMVFLCMNCCLSTATIAAFGTPDLVAWHNECTDEFKTEPVSLSTADNMTCYVYGQALAKHFAYATSDIYGDDAKLTKEDKKFVKENLKKLNKTIVEVYSPERVTGKAEKYGFRAGGALDLTTGWDFTKETHRQSALRMIRALQPVLVILSPPCTVFSTLRFLSNFKRDQHQVRAEEEEAVQHLKFAVAIARIQLRAGRGFLFEHPRSATSWAHEELDQLRNEPGVFSVPVDLCRFGLKTSKGMPALKPTLLLTNVESLAKVLNRRCEGSHAKHQPLLAGEAGLAAKYTPAFVEAILRGLRQHVQTWVKSNQQTEDYWEQDDGQLVRHHRVPRRALFSPSGVAGCPSPSKRLSSKRVSNINFINGKHQTLEDDWRSAEAPRFAFSQLWTGTTTFQLHDPIVLPPDWKAVATYITQAAAHPIHAYLTDETALQVDWKASFPTHKILGGGDLASTTSSSSSAAARGERALQADQRGERALQADRSRPRALQADQPRDLQDDMDEEETSEDRVQQALRELHLPQPPTDNILHPELRRELFRVHRNLGHPSLQVFVRALRHAGVKKEAVEWVKHHFRCDLCERKQQPSAHRPGKLQKAMEFNEVVGVDLIQVNVPNLGEYLLLNCLCWGTDMQIVEPVEDKQASTVYAAFARAWLAHYGPPGLVIADQGREFVGREFADRLGHLGVPVHYISARAPWENGRTERAGGIYKSRLETAIHEVGGVTSEEEFKTAISETSMMHNRYYNRSGYTPYQRAFGTLPRLPASLLSDDKIDKQLILESGEDAMKRAWRIREEAGKAWLKWQDDTAVRRAVSTRTRTVDMKAFEDGELVYVWRDIPGHKGWTGPGTIIAQKGDACWISMRGYLMKANKGQVRKATSEESLGAELVKHLSTTLLEDIENNRVKFFRDVAAEGLPDDDAMSGEVIGRLAEAEGDSPEVVEPAEAYSPTTPLNTLDRIDEGDEDFEMDLGDQHPLRDQAQVQPDQGVQPMLEDPPRRAPSEASTAEPSTAEVAPSVPPSLTTSQPQSRRESMNIRVDEARDGVLGFGPVRRDQQQPVMPYPCPPQGVPALPRNTRSLYFEVSKEPSEESPHWIRDRCTGHYTMNNASTEKFNISQSTGVFNYNDKCIYLTKAKTSPGQVEFRKLEEKYKKIFRASRAKEVQSLLDSGAIKILSKEESKRFLREHPQHVLTSR